MPSSHAPLVLGLPWLQKHNPVIDWVMGRVVSWSSFCHSSCLKSAHSPCTLKNYVAPPEPLDVSSVPPVYHGLAEVFSKHRAMSLPPHRPYDCAIDLRLEPIFLLAGSQPLNGKPWRDTSQNHWTQVSFDHLHSH